MSLELLDAVRANNASAALSLLEEEPALADATYGPQRNSLLHLAAPAGSPAVVQLLLRTATHIAPNAQGLDPLIAALRQGNAEAALLMLLSRHELDVNAQYHSSEDEAAAAAAVAGALDEDSTALHFAAALNTAHADTLVFALCERGADPNAPNKRMDTPLHVAVRTNNATAVRTLLICGAAPSVQAHNSAQETPLSMACARPAAAPLVVMLEKAYAANVRAVDEPQRPPSEVLDETLDSAATQTAAATATEMTATATEAEGQQEEAPAPPVMAPVAGTAAQPMAALLKPRAVQSSLYTTTFSNVASDTPQPPLGFQVQP